MSGRSLGSVVPLDGLRAVRPFMAAAFGLLLLAAAACGRPTDIDPEARLEVARQSDEVVLVVKGREETATALHTVTFYSDEDLRAECTGNLDGIEEIVIEVRRNTSDGATPVAEPEFTRSKRKTIPEDYEPVSADVHRDALAFAIDSGDLNDGHYVADCLVRTADDSFKNNVSFEVQNLDSRYTDVDTPQVFTRVESGFKVAHPSRRAQFEPEDVLSISCTTLHDQVDKLTLELIGLNAPHRILTLDENQPEKALFEFEIESAQLPSGYYKLTCTARAAQIEESRSLLFSIR